jgi:hypothetical protein
MHMSVFHGVLTGESGAVCRKGVGSEGTQEDRLRAEALLYFQKGAKGVGGAGAPSARQMIEPALEQMRDKLLKEERSLRQRMSDLKKCLDVRSPCRTMPRSHLTWTSV